MPLPAVLVLALWRADVSRPLVALYDFPLTLRRLLQQRQASLQRTSRGRGHGCTRQTSTSDSRYPAECNCSSKDRSQPASATISPQSLSATKIIHTTPTHP